MIDIVYLENIMSMIGISPDDQLINAYEMGDPIRAAKDRKLRRRMILATILSFLVWIGVILFLGDFPVILFFLLVAFLGCGIISFGIRPGDADIRCKMSIAKIKVELPRTFALAHFDLDKLREEAGERLVDQIAYAYRMGTDEMPNFEADLAYARELHNLFRRFGCASSDWDFYVKCGKRRAGVPTRPMQLYML